MAEHIDGTASNNKYGEDFSKVKVSSGKVSMTDAAALKQDSLAVKTALKDYSNGGAVNIFNGVTGYSGFYKAYDGLMTAIAFQRAGGKALLDASFLVRQVQIDWRRSIVMQRVLNNTQPIAMVGVGSGTLTLTGMIGTYGAFAGLVQDDSKENICNPLSAVIASGTGFVGCTEKGDQTNLYGVAINLSNILLTGINYRHTFGGNGDIMLQEADLTFQVGGMGLIPMGAK